MAKESKEPKDKISDEEAEKDRQDLIREYKRAQELEQAKLRERERKRTGKKETKH